jgi:DNA-binding transcriptional LysR family regulator
MLEIRQLRQFVAVAEECHFGRAAARLHMAQPPLSQAIQRLEKKLGVDLFERKKRGFSLTAAGQALLREAQTVIAGAQRAAARTQQVAFGERGRLSIGFVSAALYQILPAALRLFRQRFPGADIRLQELSTNEQLQVLQTGSIDVGFIHPPLPLLEGCETVSLGRDPLMAALTADHVFAKANSIPFSALAKEPFVLFPRTQGPSLFSAIERACFEVGVILNVVTEATRIHTQLSLVATGLGVTLVPASARSLRVDGVVYRPIADRPESFFLELCMLCYRPNQNSLVSSFKQIVQSFC